MALITCPDCGKNYSDAAVACVHCGPPITPEKTAIDSQHPRIFFSTGYSGSPCKNENQDFFKLSTKGLLVAVLVMLGVCGTGFVLWTTSSYGTGISPDSVWYISCARNLVEGKGYTIFAGHIYKHWPPLFPTLLAALYLIGIDPLIGARFLNAVIFGLIVFSSGLLFMKTIRNAYLLVFGFFLLVFSYPLLFVCSYAWSEPLLILLTVLSVLYLAQFLRNEQWSSLILFSCCAALACLGRYIGVTVVLTGGTAILIFMRQCSFFKRLKYAAFSACIALIPIAVWCIRNYSINKTLTGGRGPGGTPVILNVWISLKTCSEWFIPDILPPTLIKPILFMTIISGLALVLMFFRLKEANKSRPSVKVLLAEYGLIVIGLFFLFKTLALCFIPHLVPSSFMTVPWPINFALGIIIIALFFWLKPKHAARASAEELLAAYTFTGIYISFLVYSASIAAFDALDTRLLCPAYIFITCAVLTAVDRLVNLEGQRHNKYLWLVCTLLAFWFISWPCQKSLGLMSQQHNSGTIFSNQQLKQSPLLAWVRQNHLDGTIYCNAPWLLYINTGVESFESTNKPHDLKIFTASFTPSKDIYLIWYTKNPEQAPAFTPDELVSQLPFEPVKQLPDGAVLRLKHK